MRVRFTYGYGADAGSLGSFEVPSQEWVDQRFEEYLAMDRNNEAKPWGLYGFADWLLQHGAVQIQENFAFVGDYEPGDSDDWPEKIWWNGPDVVETKKS